MHKKRKQYRLPNYDYSQDGYYFITIVTKNRKHFFGQIFKQQLLLSGIGEFVKNNILKFYADEHLDNPYQNNPHFINDKKALIAIKEWAILPNHLHMIIEIINKEPKAYTITKGLTPLTEGSVSSFINHFKGYIKKYCIENNIHDFAWQDKFHDRIIRNEQEYKKIAKYIQGNISDWENDDGRDSPDGEF